MTAPTDRPPLKPDADPAFVPKRGGLQPSLAMLLIAAALAVTGAIVAVMLIRGDDEPSPTAATTTTVTPTTTATTSAPPTTLAPATTVVATTVPPAPPTTVPATVPEHQVLLAGTAYFSMDMQLASDGTPVFVVSGEDQMSAIVGWCSDAACTDVDTAEIPFPSGGEVHGLTLTPDDRPIVASVQWPEGDGSTQTGMWVCGDTGCTSSEFVSIGDGWEPRVAVDREGRPIAVMAAENAIVIGRCVDAQCSSTEIATINAPNTMPSAIALDASGNVEIVTTTWDPTSVQTISCSDFACSAWEQTPIAVPDQLDRIDSVTVGSGGVTAFTKLGGQLTVMTCTTPTCDAVLGIGAIDQAHDIDHGVALRSDGSPVLAYTIEVPAEDAWKMAVASCDDPTCATGTIAIIEDEHGASGVDVVMDGETPWIAFTYQMEQTAYLYRCADPRCEIGAAAVERWTPDTLETRTPVGPPAENWREIAALGRGHASGLVVLEDEFVIVGESCIDECTPIVGRSEDGDVWTWKAIEFDGVVRFSTALAIGPDRAVVAGERCPAAGDEEQPCSLALWSTDFDTWTEATIEGCEVECTGWFGDLVPTQDGALAVGDIGGWATVLSTTDGVTWSKVELPGLDNWLAFILQAVPWSDGYMAVGQDCSGDACLAIVWVSSDGASWSLIDAPQGLEIAQPDWLVAVDDTAVLLGGEWPEGATAPQPFVYTTTDGATWTRTMLEGFPGSPGRSVAFRDGLVMSTGLFDRYFGEDYTVLGWSPDLVTWELFEVPASGYAGVNLIWVDDDRVLLAGESGQGIAIWEWIPET